jgi:8-oxo-dGTP pyrophosphatase MutT (NUDIX family)
VIVVRPSEAGGAGGPGLEVLLLERSDVGAFAGYWVFPGGRVDAADAGTNEVERARSAAVREAREEVGIDIDPASLVTLSHWTPPAVTPKRFTTWFFAAPWTGQEIVIDGHEIVDHRWFEPHAALASSMQLAPPTHVTLATLVQTPTFEALTELIQRRGVERFVTRPTRHNGAMVLLWEPDAGYATGDPTIEGPRNRLVYPSGDVGGSGARYERGE